ncbi:DNA alkylation repair protein [Alkalihalobacterium bogoriense]|uniref:DNA alkylation repair protein n=1 Tax=Alkalihalobacterium bogoriense TaxID=246272 RepID=UPI00047B881D|nr:DNA alkylation repair protein [Alkalihalobacterium bogoriense]
MNVQDVTNHFQLLKNSEKAIGMSAYMKNHFEFMGIQTPDRKKATSTLFKEWQVGKKAVDWEFIFDLWEQREREYQYVAIDYLKKSKKLLVSEDLPKIKKLIITKSWWDTIDNLASGVVGHIILEFPEQVKVMDEWVNDDNMWVRRTAILHQLSFKDKTDEKRLFSYCQRHGDDKEFFIAKAIGWSLRQYAKTNPQSVITFVENTPLQNLSKREALKHVK